MTRPALRMCARCQRNTDEPVLVHLIHTPTGPGFNVYACSECATHYSSPAGPLGIPAPAGHRSRLTIHVYKINAEGAVTEERGKVEFLADEHIHPVPFTSAYPPCGCPRCRAPH
ncbi:hypothetical protein GCM10017668_41040 [Streptomyces tuirus]|uniref:Uncharacterized protein n=1 Tax=Streptomyces tuirus TaxID=68278 RepID=A0A7G1NHP0_9ACTN|nr:hypothetical protein GCM10017668_41040 [Streptomyces tuirus]